MGLTLAGGASMWLSSCDTAKTSDTATHDSLVLSHRSKFKQENASLSLWPQGKKPSPKIRSWRPTGPDSGPTQMASL